MLLNLFKQIPKLSAVRKVLEIIVFLALGSFGTLGPKLSYGTSEKFANVRTHLRKVSKIGISLIKKHRGFYPRCFLSRLFHVFCKFFLRFFV